MHIHTSPDVRPRKRDDITAAKIAAKEGMKAIVLKSHVTCTADRAETAGRAAGGIAVFGGLALNHFVGGINPFAVEASLKLGAKIIWLPTISAENHLSFHGQKGGIRVTEEDGRPVKALFGIFELLRESGAILATGHVSVAEILAVLPAARAMGLRRLVVTHPEVPWIDMPVDVQQSLLAHDVMFERCYVSTTPIGGGVPFEKIVGPIGALGSSSTIIRTDFGAGDLDFPAEGYRCYIRALLDAGISEKDVFVMGSENPGRLLDV